VIPVVSTAVPSTLGTNLEPNVLVVIAEAVTTTTTSYTTQAGITGLSPDELVIQWRN